MAVKKKVVTKKNWSKKTAVKKNTAVKVKPTKKVSERPGFDYRREEINAINRLASSIESLDQTQNALSHLLVAIFEDDGDSAKPAKAEQAGSGEGDAGSGGVGAQESGGVNTDDVPHDPDETSGDLGDEIDKLLVD